ncbi:diphthine--ammonia ligase [Nanoarchaeota archaeon]
MKLNSFFAMCGVIGVFNDAEAVNKVVSGLEVIKDRGNDGCGVALNSEVVFGKTVSILKGKLNGVGADCVLGHCLHSIVGYVPQPLQGKGLLVANCEIYNWKQFYEKPDVGKRNDSEALLWELDGVGVDDVESVLDRLDGVYAFAYWRDGKVVLCRDIFGVKPLWYSHADGRFAFASERKALDVMGFADAKELNPREILTYDIAADKISFTHRKFFEVSPEVSDDKEKIIETVGALVQAAVKKRQPIQRYGILFSGGVDSTFIAKLCEKQDCVLYSAALESDIEAEDLVYAKKAAEELGMKLKFKTITLDEVEEYLKKVVPLIEDNSVVKVGVALTFYVACDLAQKDGVKVVFSGLGSEELFAGYERHKGAANVNDECLSGLRKMYERDLYRDDVVTMNHNIELRLPFLDKKLAEYALRIPSKFKLDREQNKIILREVASGLGVPDMYAWRRKKAAQYGSRFDKAIEKLAKKRGFSSKSAYLDTFYSRNPSLGVMFSSGKDSAYALWTMMKQNYPVRCLITMKSSNPDSYMFHTPNIDLASLQAKAINVPIVVEETAGEKEKELDDLKRAILRAKLEYGIEGVVTGALYSQYQRERIEKICDSLGLKVFSPLWHMDQEKEMRQLIAEGFEVVLGSVAAEGLDKSWLGRRLSGSDVDKLVALKSKIGLNVAGEGGEFESLVLDGPMFSKRVVVDEVEVVEESENVARWVVKKASLVKKE